MSEPASRREVLIAEAIGDLGRLLDRAAAVGQDVNEACEALLEARAQFAGQATLFDSHMAALAERTKVQTVRQITAGTEAARLTLEAQTRALAQVSREAVRAEIAGSLHGGHHPLRGWHSWLTHAATAALASLATWTMSLQACGRSPW